MNYFLIVEKSFITGECRPLTIVVITALHKEQLHVYHLYEDATAEGYEYN